MNKSPCELYHDRVAHQYDDSYQTPYWQFYQAVTWHNLKRHLPHNLSIRILDIGGGTGLWGLKLAKSGYHVTIADISQKMLDVAQRKAETAKLTSRLSFVKADICDLAMFGAATFDLALAQGDPLSYCSAPNQAVKEIHRVLKPNGIFIASVDNKFGGMRVFVQQNEIDKLEKIIATGRTNWFTSDAAEQFPITYFSPDDIRLLLTRHGFSVVSTIGKTVLPLRVDSQMLQDRETFDRLLKIELKLNSEETLLGSAGHLEIVGRKTT